MARRIEKLIRFWDRQAATYDAKTRRAERRLLAASRRWVCGRARGVTLEIAVGTGANFQYYPANVDLAGVDWSAAMVAAATARTVESGREIQLRQADAAALPFASQSFDAVVCTFALCCVPDERAVLAEAIRVLRPGGDLLLADHVAATFWPLRIVQHLADLVSVPLVGEHYTRRPRPILEQMDIEIVDGQRHSLGAIEHIHARKRK
ncbi:class I SAM-dependent methyltransferase [Natronoglycomyces albus]|uniref:Class I SAM-dependent methyltransferase n=1 Tax=Natronoglycomyces albus TaxID=2811108 RepID=A0A895XQX1_9ACTN|nr:class I SAM-dependent methyltransferase [Natronoglycomyces albus]QSB04670.1 class I SAM-dependent methyltransferase [Natronoglycomyces albus]